MKKTVKVRTIEVQVEGTESGGTRDLHVRMDGGGVHIPVDETVFAYFKQQILDKKTTESQRNRRTTVMNVVRAAHNEGEMTLSDSWILDNTSAADGGGIYSTGSVRIAGCRVDGNTTLNGRGGGLFNSGTASGFRLRFEATSPNPGSEVVFMTKDN